MQPACRLQQRLLEHNQGRKARALALLQARFAAAPLSSANLAAPEAHPRVLQLLLSLAGRPLASEYALPPDMAASPAGVPLKLASLYSTFSFTLAAPRAAAAAEPGWPAASQRLRSAGRHSRQPREHAPGTHTLCMLSQL